MPLVPQGLIEVTDENQARALQSLHLCAMNAVHTLPSSTVQDDVPFLRRLFRNHLCCSFSTVLPRPFHTHNKEAPSLLRLEAVLERSCPAFCERLSLCST